MFWIYLGKGAIVPQIAVVWETVANVSELALFHILLDWVHGLFFGDLRFTGVNSLLLKQLGQSIGLTDLHLGVGPSWDLDDHIQNGLLLIGVQGNVMKG